MKPSKSVEIQNHIVNSILRNQPGVGGFLPPLTQLCRQYNAADNTVKKALTVLKKNGILQGINGLGIRVVKDPLEASGTGHLVCYVNSVLGRSRYFTNTVRSFADMNKKRLCGVKIFDERDFISSLREEFKSNKKNKNNNALLFFPEFFMDELIKNSMLQDISSITPHEKINPALLKAGTRGKKVYACPLFYSPVMLQCNARIFAECNVPIPQKPLTDEEFFAICEKLTSRSSSGVNHYGFGFSPYAYRFPALLAAFGEASNSVENTEQALMKIFSLVKKSQTAVLIPDYAEPSADELFLQERIAMRLTSLYFLDLGAEKPAFKSFFMPIPKSPQGRNFILSEYLGVPSSACNLPESAEFINTFFNNKQIRDFSKNTCVPPACTGIHNVMNAASGLCKNYTFLFKENYFDPALLPGEQYAFHKSSFYSGILTMFLNGLITAAEAARVIIQK